MEAGTLTVDFPAEDMTVVTIGDAVFDMTADETVTIPVRFRSVEPIAGIQMQLFADGEELSKNNLPISSIAPSPELVFDQKSGNTKTGQFSAMAAEIDPSKWLTVNYTIKPGEYVKPGTYHLTANVTVKDSSNNDLKTLLHAGTLTVKGNQENGNVKVTVSDAAFDLTKSNEVQVTAKVEYDQPLSAAEMCLLVNDAPYTDDVFTVKSIEMNPKLFESVAGSKEKATLTALDPTSSEESGSFDVILTLALKDGAKAGTYKLSTRSLFTSDSGNIMALEETPGTLTVPDSAAEPTDPEPTAATDPTETTGDTTPPSEPPTGIKPISKHLGDMDGDKIVGIMDVIILNKNLMVGEPLSDEAKENADVDLNGVIDEVDSLNILKAVVEIITLPVA